MGPTRLRLERWSSVTLSEMLQETPFQLQHEVLGDQILEALVREVAKVWSALRSEGSQEWVGESERREIKKTHLRRRRRREKEEEEQ